MGGLRGGSNLASWVVAGTLAYFLWIKPSQDFKRQQQEKATLAAAESDSYRKPIPDPQVSSVSSSTFIFIFSSISSQFQQFQQFQQVTGLIYGNKNKDKATKPEDWLISIHVSLLPYFYSVLHKYTIPRVNEDR